MEQIPEAPNPIQVPQGGLKTSWGLAFVGCLAAFLCMGAAILVPILKSAGSSVETQQCMGNLRRLARALTLYSEENGGLLPADDWHRKLEEFEPDTVSYACPHQRRVDPRSSGYALNKALAGKRLDGQGKDAPLVFDSAVTVPGAVDDPSNVPRPGRHRNGRVNNVAYADGRVASVPVN